jgi:hypothetical protein
MQTGSVTYSFHASAAAIAEFWNNAFWAMLSETCPKLSQCQTWHTFVQESVCTLASASGINLVLQDGLAINEVMKEAFEMLGQNGIIQAPDQHACSECTHKYKSTSDVIATDDPAALVGTDENTAVPALVVNEDAGSIIQEQIQSTIGSTQTFRNDDDMDVDYSPVKLVVVDGIIMGPNVSILIIRCN